MADVKVKICGLKTPAALACAVEYGADYVGLVVHEPSCRHVPLAELPALVKVVPKSVKTVAVTVDPAPDLIRQLLDTVDIIQIHGHADEAVLREFARWRVWRAINIRSAADVQNLDRLYADAVVADSVSPGSGRVCNWDLAKKITTYKLFLAGGLSQDNVFEAIAAVHPYGVDLSSSLESERGVKSIDKIKAFLQGIKS